MKIFMIGICGTFMGSLALIAKELGHEVVGSDANVYPPMSTQLTQSGIEIFSEFDAEKIPNDVDQVIVGNIAARGNPQVEYILNNKIPYTSGPAWLNHNVLQKKQVIAVAGVHGKTTTSSMIAWILKYAKLNPGFLIGGVPQNFGISACIGSGKYFVIEADEYDSAFFDKRSKFIHYQPDVAVINNIEFDHADIYADLNAIKTSFHHFIRTIASDSTIIYPNNDKNIVEVLAKGIWSKQCTIGQRDAEITYKLQNQSGAQFAVLVNGELQGMINWQLIGIHNVYNALAAIAAVSKVGIPYDIAINALNKFTGVGRRMEYFGEQQGITFYEDFAHHPSAIKQTLYGVRKSHNGRIIVALDFASNTMKMGTHKEFLPDALKDADNVICYQHGALKWPIEQVTTKLAQPYKVCDNITQMVATLQSILQAGDRLILMSNGSFGGLKLELINAYNLAQNT